MPSPTLDPAALAQSIKEWGRELGFQQVGITDVNLGEHEAHLEAWLAAGYQGEMDYMAAHGSKRSRPDELVPGTLRVISLRMDYLPGDTRMTQQLAAPEKAYVSRYALGRDYHKLIRKRIQQLAERIQQVVGPFGFRAFVDSAPVLEKAAGQQAGLGWIGKNTLLLNRKAGSWFFLGELFVDIALPVDEPTTRDHCGSCHACLDVCPTDAFVGERLLDARRCISYLTIELKGPIPHEFRKPIGNRIYGCDDCLAVCPWNKFAREASEAKLVAREDLQEPRLADLLMLDDAGFRALFSGSPVKRIGRDRFIRNVLIAAGNSGEAALAPQVRSLLADASPLVRGAAVWALAELAGPAAVAGLRDDDPEVAAEIAHVLGDERRYA